MFFQIFPGGKINRDAHRLILREKGRRWKP
jgi:hypothetical protein